jgi:MYXO-CTERM domain-containing protein
LISVTEYQTIKLMKKKTVFLALSLCFVLAFSSPVVIYAQDNRPSARVDDDDDDDGMDFGWIGLIGLAGLLGLRKKDNDYRDDRVRTGGSTVR